MNSILLVLGGCAAVSLPFDASREPPFTGEQAVSPWGVADWTVETDGSGDFTSIGDAIRGAADGDWILVGAGTYEETLDYGGKSLWISSRDGKGATTLDAGQRGYAVSATSAETAETGFVGFTVKNARDAAFWVVFASLHVEDVTITDTTGAYSVFGSAADMELQDVVFENNTQSTAGIYMSRGSLQANGITLDCDRGSYAVYTGHGYAQIDQSTITCGRGGYALAGEHTTGTITRSSLRGNVSTVNEDDHPEDLIALVNTVLEGSYAATYGGALIRNSVIDGGSFSFTAFAETPGTPVVENSVFMNTTCAISHDAATATIRNNAFVDTTASCTGNILVGLDGNIDGDPDMVDAANGDYHLNSGSPLQDAGVDEWDYEDIDGSRNDIGAFGGHFSMDGGW
ncbi:MAG: hypothetical protein EXR71_09315 [Myxococcales bacterium]|nr:hypothetical protein [Myxococcales bacterium]